MTPYELLRALIGPALPTIQSLSRREVLRLAATNGGSRSTILDVGGRMSPYTVGARASVTVMDMPPDSAVREGLHLGLTSDRAKLLMARRSNISAVLIQDMTQCTLPDASFDGVTCIEEIEHVPEDRRFLAQIARVLRPDGWLLLTTPNGDYIKNVPPDYNPDHVRHYMRRELTDLLSNYFEEVRVRYAVKTGRYRYWGLRSLSLRRPFASAKGVLGNLISHWESRGLDEQPRRTAHLVAVARRPRHPSH